MIHSTNWLVPRVPVVAIHGFSCLGCPVKGMGCGSCVSGMGGFVQGVGRGGSVSRIRSHRVSGMGGFVQGVGQDDSGDNTWTDANGNVYDAGGNLISGAEFFAPATTSTPAASAGAGAGAASSSTGFWGTLGNIFSSTVKAATPGIVSSITGTPAASTAAQAKAAQTASSTNTLLIAGGAALLLVLLMSRK